MTKKDRCMIAYEKYIKNVASGIKNKKVLDIGCGRGNYTKLFCRNKNQVCGVDVSDFRKEKYKDRFKFIKYNGKKIPFDDNVFDCVVSWDVIEHVKKDISFLSESLRVLKRGGGMYLRNSE